MAYATAKEISLSEIPVIDISGLNDGTGASLKRVAGELRRAAETAGFFYIRDHGIPQPLIDRTFALADRFFHAPVADKRSVTVSPHHRGWLAVGEAKMYGNAKPDLKESYVWGLDIPEDDSDYRAGGRLLAPNQWPEFLPELRPVLNDYMAEVQACGERLLRAFATSLAIDPDYFIREIGKPVSRGAIIYYPPQRPDSGEDQFGVGAHTDFGALTMLYQDSTGGLQVWGKSGEWLTAHPVEGAYVVNVGDLLARWTNDRFTSTPHRVVNSSGRERVSVAVFVDPNWDADIRPVVFGDETPNYEPVRCADYINDRYAEAFRYRQGDEAGT